MKYIYNRVFELQSSMKNYKTVDPAAGFHFALFKQLAHK